MFLKRLLTALVLVPLVLLLILYAKPGFWLEFAILVSLLAINEYWQLIPANTPVMRMGFLFCMLLGLIACSIVFPYWQTLGLLLWLFICFALVTFPKSQNYWGYPRIVALIHLIFWPLFIVSMARIYSLPQGRELIIYLLFLVWSADTGAYLVGKVCGRHKLIPKVSPGKSWEGVIGGLILGLVVAGGAYKYFVPYSKLIWFSLALVTLVSTVVGDLCISIFKRRCHVKDTGDLIPGHGGILDRLDSLIAAAPVFYFGLMYIPLGI